MAKYKLTEDENVVQNKETTAFIPKAPGEQDWQEYQNWLKGLGPDGPDGEPGEPLGTGPNTPDPQYTPEEIEAKSRFEKTLAENAVIEAKVNLDAATAEGIDRKRFQDELIKAKADLAALNKPVEIKKQAL